MTRRLLDSRFAVIAAALVCCAVGVAVKGPVPASALGTKLRPGATYVRPSKNVSTADRPDIYSIAFVRFKSVDLEKSRAFYGKILGLLPGFDNCKGLTDPCFTVNSDQYVVLSQAGSGTRGSFLEEVGFNVSGVEKMHKYLAAHRQKPGPVTRGPNGLLYFETQDPEHNKIAFVESVGTDVRMTGLNQVSDVVFHAGWVVHDLALEKKFYQDLLGFRLYWRGGFKDADTDWYEIQVPDGDNWVEFMLNIPESADHAELGVQNHFSLGVKDIKACAAKLRANGLQSKDEPEIGRDGKWSYDIYDPDGNRVEFMEFAPAQRPCCHPYTAAHPK
jgi:catechol 2,3-dioxygenase-like lactoylglutathione lyase family enzyme